MSQAYQTVRFSGQIQICQVCASLIFFIFLLHCCSIILTPSCVSFSHKTDFNENFTEDLLTALPISQLLDIKNDLNVILSLKELRDNLAGNSFEAHKYYTMFLNAVIDYATRMLEEETSFSKMCVKRVINEAINQEVLNIIIAELELLHSARSALGKLYTFASEQLLNRLENARVLGDCVMDYIRTAFCHHCTENPIPLCLQTCNALVRGCYSPYYTVLKAQYNDLWTEAQCVLGLINDTVMNILLNESKLLDLQTLVRQFDNTQ